jgi:hypothetical protein
MTLRVGLLSTADINRLVAALTPWIEQGMRFVQKKVTPENLNTLLGKVCRIDVDHKAGGKNYAVPKDKPKFREAVHAAMMEIYKSGDQAALLKKWELDVNNFKEPDILSVK